MTFCPAKAPRIVCFRPKAGKADFFKREQDIQLSDKPIAKYLHLKEKGNKASRTVF